MFVMPGLCRSKTARLVDVGSRVHYHLTVGIRNAIAHSGGLGFKSRHADFSSQFASLAPGNRDDSSADC